MTYSRTAEQRTGDFKAARAFEEEVASFLPPYKVTRFDLSDDLDIWVPGYFVECKEKRQMIGTRWLEHFLGAERDCFILDELSLRRALRHFPMAYFLIRDVPGDRLFVDNAIVFACIARTRVNRAGKGKLLIDLQDLHRLPSLDQLGDWIQSDMVAMPWKQSACLGLSLTPEV